MKIAIAASTISTDCAELKYKIIHYLQDYNLDIMDVGSSNGGDPSNPLLYLKNIATMVKKGEVNKAISICKMGVSATKAAASVGIPAEQIAQQNVIEAKNLFPYKILTLGSRFPWEETKLYIDSFIKE